MHRPAIASAALRRARALGWSFLLTLCLVPLLRVPPAAANPIAPHFWATDGVTFFDIYITMNPATGQWRWFAMSSCTFPGVQSTARDFDFDVPVASGIEVEDHECVRFGGYGCDVLGPPAATSRTFTGIEYVDGTLYAVCLPDGSGPQGLWTLDPVSGAAAMRWADDRLLDAQLCGLAHDPTDGMFYALGCCASPPGPAGGNFLVRLGGTSGGADATWPIVLPSGTPATGLTSIEYTTAGLFVGSSDGELYVTDFVERDHVLVAQLTRVTPTDDYGIAGIRALVWSGYELPVTAHRKSWGQLKATYR